MAMQMLLVCMDIFVAVCEVGIVYLLSLMLLGVFF
jgi:hypothetical protein